MSNKWCLLVLLGCILVSGLSNAELHVELDDFTGKVSLLVPKNEFGTEDQSESKAIWAAGKEGKGTLGGLAKIRFYARRMEDVGNPILPLTESPAYSITIGIVLHSLTDSDSRFVRRIEYKSGEKFSRQFEIDQGFIAFGRTQNEGRVEHKSEMQIKEFKLNDFRFEDSELEYLGETMLWITGADIYRASLSPSDAFRFRLTYANESTYTFTVPEEAVEALNRFVGEIETWIKDNDPDAVVRNK